MDHLLRTGFAVLALIYLRIINRSRNRVAHLHRSDYSSIRCLGKYVCKVMLLTFISSVKCVFLDA